MLDPGEQVSRNATMNPEVGVSTSKRSGQDGAFHYSFIASAVGVLFFFFVVMQDLDRVLEIYEEAEAIW